MAKKMMDADVTSGPLRTLIIIGMREANTLKSLLDREERLGQILEANARRLLINACAPEWGDEHPEPYKEILIEI
jgi:hypothetical protein